LLEARCRGVQKPVPKLVFTSAPAAMHRCISVTSPRPAASHNAFDTSAGAVLAIAGAEQALGESRQGAGGGGGRRAHGNTWNCGTGRAEAADSHGKQVAPAV
jgi:hypothetical protein